MADILDLVARDESGNRNVPNYKYGPGFTAGGYWQITDTNWKHYAPQAGLSLADYPNAMAAPRPAQRQVADLMRQEQGLRPWLPYNPQLRRDLGDQAEGYYGGALHVNIHPPPPPGQGDALDSLLGLAALSMPAPAEPASHDDDAMALVNSLLQPQGAPQAREDASRYIEPPAAQQAPPAPPEPPADVVGTQGHIDVSPLDSIMQSALPQPQPMTAAGGVAPLSANQFIEPPAAGETPPAAAAQVPASAPPVPSAMAPGSGGMPFDPSRPHVENQADPLDQFIAAARDLGSSTLGLGQMAAQGFNTMVGLRGLNQPGRAPVRPGIGRAADIATFATGGLMNPLGAETRAGLQAAPGAAREAGEAVPGVLADVRGGPPGRITGPGIEPPPPRTDLVPAGGGAGPPGPPPGGVPGRAGPPPPSGPQPMPASMVRATTSPPRQPAASMGKESAAVKSMKLDMMRQTQDTLWQVWERSEEFKDRVLRTYWPHMRMSAEEKLQIERYIEWQPGMPQVAISAEAKELADKAIRPMIEAGARDYTWLKQRGVSPAPGADLGELTEGYLHRIRANKGPPGRHPFEPFGGVRGLRRSAPSQQPRTGWYVLQDEAGNRVFSKDLLEQHGYAYGDKVQSGGKTWEVRRPTTEEIEGNNTDVRYLHDPLLASLQNMVQLRTARRNYEALTQTILPDLDDAGLSTTSAEAATRLGMTESQIPSLRGHYFEPRITHALNDFYRTPQAISGQVTDAFSWIGSANRFAIASMFINPIGHMRNVLGDYALSRGGLWASPPAYARQAAAMRSALDDVMKMTPFYRDVMKAGGALRGASAGNRIALRAFFDRARRDLTTLPNIDQIAEQTGIWKTGKAWAEAVWNGSQHIMWSFHDLLLLARVRELMAEKRLGIETATREAERFIADYRVPATIGEEGATLRSLDRIGDALGSTQQPSTQIARALSVLMQDRTLSVFGRYHYNKLRSLANVLRDSGRAMSNSGMTSAERSEALGRLAAVLFFSTVAQQGINFAVQQASGNPEARLSVPGALGIPANAARVAADLYRSEYGQANYDFWMGLASIITPIPALSEFVAQMTNRRYGLQGGPPIRGDQLPAGQQLRQSLTHAAEEMLPPLGEAARIVQGKGVPFLGLSLPDPGAAAWARATHPREYRKQERSYQRQLQKSPF